MTRFNINFAPRLVLDSDASNNFIKSEHVKALCKNDCRYEQRSSNVNGGARKSFSRRHLTSDDWIFSTWLYSEEATLGEPSAQNVRRHSTPTHANILTRIRIIQYLPEKQPTVSCDKSENDVTEGTRVT